MTRSIIALAEFAMRHSKTCGMVVDVRADGTTLVQRCSLCGAEMTMATSLDEALDLRTLAFVAIVEAATRRIVQ